MTVRVEPPPIAPTFSGNWETDREAAFKFMRDLARVANQLRERTGGSTDLVASSADTASTAAANAMANSAGAVVPAPGGAVELSPSNPLSYEIESLDFAIIEVAGHTRTGAGAALVGDRIPGVARGATGATYYVYYVDAGNAGGVQTFLADGDLAVVRGTAGYRYIGPIYIPPPSYAGRKLS